ncbi:hypothetical protein [Marinobacter sp. CA1]|uniref:hypothetical protein n=1 Tax=Marinobacter sp. CA1 TaxID=2817656 RepID=UPI001D06A581|nr:hypothetical protein [Marinobacter sp. CA1]UDL05082.1 hypothetical protein J2887_20910 [Marinobacter sp. CA1]
MLSISFDRLKLIERPAKLLTKALIVLFWLCAGFEVYELYYARSEEKPEYFFFTMGGGIFAGLFYLCIAYFFLLRAFLQPPGVKRMPQKIVHMRKYGAIVVAAFFIYAAAATVVGNLTSG